MLWACTVPQSIAATPHSWDGTADEIWRRKTGEGEEGDAAAAPAYLRSGCKIKSIRPLSRLESVSPPVACGAASTLAMALPSDCRSAAAEVPGIGTLVLGIEAQGALSLAASLSQRSGVGHNDSRILGAYVTDRTIDS
jgi:hypothetical protein